MTLSITCTVGQAQPSGSFSWAVRILHGKVRYLHVSHLDLAEVMQPKLADHHVTPAEYVGLYGTALVTLGYRAVYQLWVFICSQKDLSGI
jgi:hypothetical protein